MFGKTIDHPDVLTFLSNSFGAQINRAIGWQESGRAIPVRYEELHEDPVTALMRVTAAIKPVEEATIRWALEVCRADRVRQQWERWWQGVPLVVVPSPYRSIVGPLLEYLEQLDAESGDGQLASILLPEFVPAKWWQHLLHNQTAWLLKLALLYRRRRFGKVRAIIDIPWYLRE